MVKDKKIELLAPAGLPRQSKKKRKIELLAPAGSLEKMKYALAFGADAVYLDLPDFSLRVRINKFSEQDFVEAVEYAHAREKKVYVTLNIYAHNRHLKKIEEHLEFLRPLRVDGVIVSDPGIINLAKKHLPGTEIHLSTQANATNVEAVKFWQSVGVTRIVLARELSLKEIKEIKKAVPKMELEVFIHGAMCMSYSGRSILSKWMTNRSANLGDCSQPCRWAYKNQKSKIKNQKCGVSADAEVDNLNLEIIDDQGRFGMDIEEDEHGTYFFNSYDMNLIEHVAELLEAGITSLKIEGRAKSAYYVAVATRAYRQVIDALQNKKSKKIIAEIITEQKNELDKLTNRGYSTGFLLGEEPPHNFSGELFGGKFEFVGEVLEDSNRMGEIGDVRVVKVHNAVEMSDDIEVVTPAENIKVKIKNIFDDQGRKVTEAHGGHAKLYRFEFDRALPEGSLLRKI